MRRQAVIGDEFGQVRAITRYHAMRQTPGILSDLAAGRLVAAYAGVNRRGGAESLSDLDYVFMPASELLGAAGRLVDSLVSRDGAQGAASKGVYVDATDSTGGARRLRAAPGAAPMVGRLSGAEIDALVGTGLLEWSHAGTHWQLRSFPSVEFEHPPLVLIAGRPASQSVYAAVPVTAWEASLVELLRRSRADH